MVADHFSGARADPNSSASVDLAEFDYLLCRLNFRRRILSSCLVSTTSEDEERGSTLERGCLPARQRLHTVSE